MKSNIYSIVFGCVLAAAATGWAQESSQQQEDVVMTAVHGSDLSAAQVARLEKELKKNPTDFTSRAKLLGYYFMRQNSAAAKIPYTEQVLWVIANRPADGIAGTPYAQLNKILNPNGYEQAKELWIKQTKAHPKNVQILSHAASFLESNDADIAEDLYKKCATIDPQNSDWLAQLAQMYHRKAQTGGADQKQLAAKALATQELAVRLATDPNDHFYQATDLPVMAIDAGDFNKAVEYARDLLKEAPRFPHDWNYGNAIFYANIALGSASLQAGDINQAAKYLLAAGNTPGSCQLDSFGPTFLLADQLLKHGQQKVVLEYLDEVSRFWGMGSKELSEWKKQIAAGNTPNFGVHLR